MVTVGILLIAGLALIAVEAIGYSRGGYDSEFWALPLDDKLDRVEQHRWAWWWISIWGLVGLFLMTGGLAGLTYLLVDAGEPLLASIAFGGYLVALFSWVLGLIIQSASVSRAARQRAETGETPSWIHPLWDAGYFAEAAFIVGTNLVYAVIGVAIIQSGLVAAWAGWVAIAIGLLIPVVVLVTRFGFPQMGIVAPAVIGVALLIESM